MPHRPRSAALVTAAATAVAAAIVLTACTGDPWESPHDPPAAIGELGAGFEPSDPPSPEATIEPAAGSWDDVRPSPGYRVVLLTSGDDATTRTLADSVRDWAEDAHVDLREVQADTDHIDGIVEAMDLGPDLIVSVGDQLIDPLALVTASHLDQQFLIVGAEIAEPTENVTAVDWTGASFRGEGLGTASDYDAATFTPERGGRAIRAGVAAVLHDLTGIVVWID
ncbi:hypothetical protein [Homoserinibacter sp. GY 40078]|uniref:hypothetical protein n=1 Tax=Homoserinibacter sp. GY 40078 TaxID=2603275 RepID=UPI0011C81C7B|nr:hypothetical protein [Homoserinibacter sp. GY 40078]TXK19237.1 hypothetical protein FVQ89_04805 [Homoserinibacter sp. GY 40078]